MEISCTVSYPDRVKADKMVREYPRDNRDRREDICSSSRDLDTLKIKVGSYVGYCRRCSLLSTSHISFPFLLHTLEYTISCFAHQRSLVTRRVMQKPRMSTPLGLTSPTPSDRYFDFSRPTNSVRVNKIPTQGTKKSSHKAGGSNNRHVHVHSS